MPPGKSSNILSTVLDAVAKSSIGKYKSVQLTIGRIQEKIDLPELSKSIQQMNALIKQYKPELDPLNDPATKIDCTTLKKTYRALAMILHPDKAPPEKRREYEAAFKQLTEAYGELNNACSL
jgi:preprotein translocase subunit Sec63